MKNKNENQPLKKKMSGKIVKNQDAGTFARKKRKTEGKCHQG